MAWDGRLSLGRLGDMYGRVLMYDAGFVVFTVASLGLAFTPFTGRGGALWLIASGLISGPFHDGLVIVFGPAAAMSLGAALLSLWHRGGRHDHGAAGAVREVRLGEPDVDDLLEPAGA